LLDRNLDIKGIAEIFGFYTEDYKLHQAKKKDFFSTLENIDFIFWDANYKAALPKQSIYKFYKKFY
jgi:hypothetical protein